MLAFLFSKLKDHLQIKTKINFINYQDNINHLKLVNLILHNKHAVMTRSCIGEKLSKYINSKYLIPIHHSEEKLFLSIKGIVFNKSLPEHIYHQINQM